MNNIAKSKILMATGETGMMRGDVHNYPVIQRTKLSEFMKLSFCEKKENWLYSTVSTIINSETVENI